MHIASRSVHFELQILEKDDFILGTFEVTPYVNKPISEVSFLNEKNGCKLYCGTRFCGSSYLPSERKVSSVGGTSRLATADDVSQGSSKYEYR